MTTAHAGACVLLTADRKLAGIFTHGDFVRAYGANPLIGEQPVSGFMTRNPIYVMEEDLAGEAAKAVSNPAALTTWWCSTRKWPPWASLTSRTSPG